MPGTLVTRGDPPRFTVVRAPSWQKTKDTPRTWTPLFAARPLAMPRGRKGHDIQPIALWRPGGGPRLQSRAPAESWVRRDSWSTPSPSGWFGPARGGGCRGPSMAAGSMQAYPATTIEPARSMAGRAKDRPAPGGGKLRARALFLLLFYVVDRGRVRVVRLLRVEVRGKARRMAGEARFVGASGLRLARAGWTSSVR